MHKKIMPVPQECYAFLKSMGLSKEIVDSHMAIIDKDSQQDFIDHVHYLMTAEQNLLETFEQYKPVNKKYNNDTE